MGAACVDQCGCRPPIQIVGSPAHHGVAVGRQVRHGGREVQLAREPGLHDVVLRGDHIHQVARLKRPDVRRDHFGRDPAAAAGAAGAAAGAAQPEAGAEQQHGRDAHAPGAGPSPGGWSGPERSRSPDRRPHRFTQRRGRLAGGQPRADRRAQRLNPADLFPAAGADPGCPSHHVRAAPLSSPSAYAPSSRAPWRAGRPPSSFHLLGLEHAPEPAPRPGEPRHHRPDRHAADGRDFLVAELLDLTHHDDLAEGKRERVHRADQPFLEVEALECRLGVVAGARDRSSRP